MVVNKRNNKFTYFEISSNVKEVRLKTESSNMVELIVKNKDPLQIELWVDTASDIELAVEFKDSAN
jgi:hypothetical protein